MARPDNARPWPALPAGTAITNDVNGVNFVASAGKNATPRSSWDVNGQSASFATGPEKEASQ